MIGILCLCCLFTLVNVMPSSRVVDDLFPLTIAHINDFHSRFEETDVKGDPCKPNEKCIGGLARVVYTIRKIFEEQRKKDIDSLYINAGDNFQGTIWYNLGRWNVTTQLMNIKPPDAMVLGNHEFDHGIDGVLPFINNMNQTKIVVANMNATDEPRMQNKIKPFTIIKKKNRSIGIIGVILEGVPNLTSTGKLTFRNESEAIMKAARELKEEDPKINIIIVVSHVGFEVDKIIAEHTGSEVDIIVGGHSHTFLYTGIPPGLETPEDNYPYVYEHSSGNKVLIVQAACHAKYVGNLTVFFDKDGKLTKYEGAPIYMNSDVEKDQQVLEAMEPWKQLIYEKSKDDKSDEKRSGESNDEEENTEKQEEDGANKQEEKDRKKRKGKKNGRGKEKEGNGSSEITEDGLEEVDIEEGGEDEKNHDAKEQPEERVENEVDVDSKDRKINSDGEDDTDKNNGDENNKNSEESEENANKDSKDENDEENEEINNGWIEDDSDEDAKEDIEEDNGKNSKEENKEDNDEESMEDSDEQSEEDNDEESEEDSDEESEENSDEESEENSDEESEEDSDEMNEDYDEGSNNKICDYYFYISSDYYFYEIFMPAAAKEAKS